MMYETDKKKFEIDGFVIMTNDGINNNEFKNYDLFQRYLKISEYIKTCNDYKLGYLTDELKNLKNKIEKLLNENLKNENEKEL